MGKEKLVHAGDQLPSLTEAMPDIVPQQINQFLELVKMLGGRRQAGHPRVYITFLKGRYGIRPLRLPIDLAGRRFEEKPSNPS